MSFVNTRTKGNAVMQSAQKSKTSRVEMKIDVVPIPLAASLSNPLEKMEKQSVAIKKIETLGKDLFEANKTIVSQKQELKLYQTADLYSESLSLEKLIPMLTSGDLTLRLNAVRTGAQSSTTCMELKTGILADLIEKQLVDERNEKTATVDIQTSSEIGQMFIGVKVKRGQHYISKLDYEVPTAHDERMHV